MLARAVSASILAAALPAAAGAADLSCNGLVAPGRTMICAGFEPNWAVELSCNGAMNSNFIDAFSGDVIEETPGTIDFSTENPWTFQTSHGIEGTIAYTPGGCTDEGDNVHDFTFTPTAAPGLSAPFFPFCCRMR